MRKIRDLWPKGLEGKLIKFVLIFVLCIGTAFLTVSYFQVSHLKDVVKEEGEKQTDLAQDSMEKAMTGITVDSLMTLNTWAADKIDDEFWILAHDIRVLASQVEDVYRNPDRYELLSVEQPKKSDAGKYVLQLLYPGGDKRADNDDINMIRRLANLEPMMAEIVRDNEGFAMDCLIATPGGLTLVMDNLSDKKFDEAGNIDYYDPRDRAWYKGAAETGDIFVSSALRSAFYDYNEVVMGYPVYLDGELVAVVEVSTKLDEIEKKMSERKVGNNGFAILISDEGQLVCSSKESGELMMGEDTDTDIRGAVNPELKELLTKALSGESGIEKVMVDSDYYHAAYSPVDTAGWTQITFVNENEILNPIKTLNFSMEVTKDLMLVDLSNHFKRSTILVIIILILIMLIAMASASSLAKKRVLPIQNMTEAVEGFVGQNMDFEMKDEYRTGDEIENLAESFETMSVKMKEYVKEIVNNAAEKERLQTEMEAARDIQNKMLPKRYPDFYNKPGYELYAKMTPAKNVGGDLYDFFYLDDDHLAVMLGDVSGKGVTAALFMVLCKQMIKSQLLAKDGDLVAAMTEANLRLLEEAADGMFVTVWLGVITLSTGELNFVDAGHMYAAIKRGDGDFVIEPDNHSMLVGALDFARFQLNTIKLEKGDMFYLYTDGVTEARNSDDEMFGEDRLLEALNEASWFLSVGELDTLVRNRVLEFAGDQEQYDDITTLVFKYTGID